MLQLNVLPESNKVLVRYPTEARIPSKMISIYTQAQLQRKWETETREYIYSTLRKWVVQRNHAYKATKELTGPRAAASDKLLLTLINYQYSTLHSMCRKVVDNYDLFWSIMPSAKSKNVEYAKQVIAPILLWCKEYRDQVNAKNEKIHRVPPKVHG